MKTKMKSMLLVAGLSLSTQAFLFSIAGLCPLARAAVIYQDDFTGDAGTLLNGRAPNVFTATTNTYTAATVLQLDGSGRCVSGNGGGYASIALPALTSNDVIVIEGVFRPWNSANVNNWLGFGLAGDPGGITGTGTAWAYLRGGNKSNQGQVTVFSGNGIAGQLYVSTSAEPGFGGLNPSTLKITYTVKTGNMKVELGTNTVFEGLIAYGGTTNTPAPLSAMDYFTMTWSAGDTAAGANPAFFDSITVKTHRLLPRIGIKSENGKSVLYNTETGESFQALGFTHTNSGLYEELGFDSHALLTPEYYDPDAMEEVLSHLETFGYNTIRVFMSRDNGVDGAPEGAAGKSTNTTGISSAYMENVIDFLRRAGNHGIYTVLAVNQTPKTTYYNSIYANTPATPDFGAENGNWGSAKMLNVRSAYASNIVQYIKSNDPDLLSNILCLLICGTAHSRAVADEQPFTYTSGYVTNLNGSVYDMSSDAARQNLFNDSMVYWADTIGDSIKSVDANALVGVSIGAYEGDIGQSPGLYWTNGIRQQTDWWNKHPALPWPLMNAAGNGADGYDIVDLHVYKYANYSPDVRLQASQTGLCNLDNGKVLVAFEFGASIGSDGIGNFIGISPAEISRDMQETRKRLFNIWGFEGALFFAYKNLGFDTEVYCAMNSYGQIFSKLTPDMWDSWPIYNPTFHDVFTNGLSNWTIASGSWTIDSSLESLYHADKTSTGSITVNTRTFKDFEMETDLILRDGNWAGIQFRKNQLNDGPFASGYTAFLRSNGSLSLYSASAGTLFQSDETAVYNVTNMQMTLKVKACGTNLTVSLNGIDFIQIADSGYTNGYCGLVSREAKAIFDDVSIKKIQ